MTTRTKEEQQLLDEKIARIQKKNEEILRRQKEIEEDKRLAEQQNAVVKLRPSTTNLSRERTPALKPSNRELREEFSDDDPFQEQVVQKNKRGSFRGRGADRYRGQGDWKSNGPPPDPKSFLHDDERDAAPRDKDGKGDQRRDLNRGRRGEERDNRDEYRGGREFQRGGRSRGIGEYRGERGRRGGGSSRSEEEAWRAERMRIDEARIQRQKSADGKWRREWDNEKIMLEPLDEPRYDQRKQNLTQEPRRPANPPQSCMYIPPDNNPRPYHRGGARGGRGRGRLDISELEMSVEKFKLDVPHKPISPVKQEVTFVDNIYRSQRVDGPTLTPPSHHDNFKLDVPRSIEMVGETFKISIPNSNVTQTTSKAERQVMEPRGRYRSQTSYSSQSDEESPRDRGNRGGRRQRNQKFQKNQLRNHNNPKTRTSIGNQPVTTEELPSQNKPPLPPFRSDPKPSPTSEGKDGEESWEDVTTSGTESMGEELSCIHSTPLTVTIPYTNEMVQMESVHSEVFDNVQVPEQYEDVDPPYNIDQYMGDIKIELLEQSSTGLPIKRFDSQNLLEGELLIGTQNISDESTSHLDISSTISQIENDFENFIDKTGSLHSSVSSCKNVDMLGTCLHDGETELASVSVDGEGLPKPENVTKIKTGIGEDKITDSKERNQNELVIGAQNISDESESFDISNTISQIENDFENLIEKSGSLHSSVSSCKNVDTLGTRLSDVETELASVSVGESLPKSGNVTETKTEIREEKLSESKEGNQVSRDIVEPESNGLCLKKEEGNSSDCCKLDGEHSSNVEAGTNKTVDSKVKEPSQRADSEEGNISENVVLAETCDASIDDTTKMVQ